MTSTVGPYLRIEQPSSLQANFYMEYNITASEGLDVYMRELSSLSPPTCVLSRVLFLLTVSVTVVSCR
ncbi:uncharacterized protein LOC124372811 [Homalodisca vitripennis]|nr:uncharacterized protein LOC124372811 [Homalodisca vitripennis]